MSNKENVELCDYGCGQIATHTFKNGKKCCSIKTQFCPKVNYPALKDGASPTGCPRITGRT